MDPLTGALIVLVVPAVVLLSTLAALGLFVAALSVVDLPLIDRAAGGTAS